MYGMYEMSLTSPPESTRQEKQRCVGMTVLPLFPGFSQISRVLEVSDTIKTDHVSSTVPVDSGLLCVNIYMTLLYDIIFR